MVGLSVIGCSPTVRKDIEGEECSAEINKCCANYNEGLKSMLQITGIRTQGRQLLLGYLQHPQELD
jgi:hypothetical protein